MKVSVLPSFLIGLKIGTPLAASAIAPRKKLSFAESGFAGFEAPAWWAGLAPAKTPPEIIKRMNEELNKAIRAPDLAKRMDAQGIDVVGGTPESARVFIERQMDIWSKVVKENDIKAD